jgi:hypothetical protein
VTSGNHGNQFSGFQRLDQVRLEPSHKGSNPILSALQSGLNRLFRGANGLLPQPDRVCPQGVQNSTSALRPEIHLGAP